MATILVVDDLAANRKFLVTLLRHQGHRLLEAADGREGLAAVQAEHPDLVITDVLMPVMDGYEFVRQLRLDPATSGIPVVFYTAHYGEREARALALSSGVSYVLTKPAESAEVLKIVGRVLSGESETRLPQTPLPLTTEFDREHLRLLTDKLSEKAGDLRTANARLRALINIGLELASERDSDRLLQSVCVAARDLFGATYVTLGILDRHDRTRAAFRHRTDADAGQLDQDRRRCPGNPRDGRRRATDVAWRQSWRRSGQAAASRRSIRTSRPFWPRPSRHRPMSTVGSVSSATRARTFTEDDEHLVMALSGQVGRIYELEQLRSSSATGGVGAAPRAGPGAAIPGHGRSHPARAGPGRADHADQPQGLRPPRMDRRRAARARLDRDLPSGPDAGCTQEEVSQPGRRRSFHRREPDSHQVRRGTADRMAQHAAARRRRAASSARSVPAPTSPSGTRQKRSCACKAPP